MFLSIYHNQSGEEYIRRLGPNAHLDLREYVRQWVADLGFDEPHKPAFSEPGAHIFNGCAEYQAELRDTKKGGASCWTSEPFYIVPVEGESE